MLFSQESVARFINDHFEAVWQSVRPVPIITLDFGDGKVLTRTLHGNILTSICTSDGRLVDALPGIYEEKAYVKALQALQTLGREIAALPETERQAHLLTYHRQQIALLKALRRADLRTLPISKGRIERPVELVLQDNPSSSSASVSQANTASAGKAPAETDLPRWRALLQDTRLNERTRRRQIHELLAVAGRPLPEQVLRPIYRDVLHADLDDPYLGLGKVLFANYPFSREDKEL